MVGGFGTLALRSQALDEGNTTRRSPAARAALVCAAVVACLLGGYEIVERVWLQNADANLLRVLHIIRGIGAGAVGAIVAWFLARRLPAIFPARTESPSAPLAVREETTLAQSARWFIAARWHVVCVLLAATLLGVPVLSIIPRETLLPLLATVGGLALSNLAWGYAFPRIKRYDRFLIHQMTVDLLILTVVLHFSGGIENPFSRVYIFHIVLASVLLRPRSGYAVTALASLLLICLGVGEAQQWLPHYPIALFPYPREAAVTVFPAHYMPFAIGKMSACLLVFWVTAFFGALLGNQLRFREESLRRVAEDIQASEQRLQAVVNSMGAALMLWSRDLRLVWCNQTAREWFRFDEAQGAVPCRQASDSEIVRAACRECAPVTALNSGLQTVIERPHPLSSNGGRMIRIQAFPIRNSQGDVAQVLELVQDITDEKAMQAQVLHSEKMAVLGRMAAALAHEIGNPLSAMATRLERLEHPDDPAFLKKSLSFFREQVGRIHRLVTSITRFSKPSGLQPTRCDVAAVLDQVVGMLRMDRRARNILVEARSDPCLPQVFAIPDQLVQVFLNLGLNALEAMPDAGQLVVRAEAVDRQLRISFTDSGCGLSEEVRSNLFHPFFTTKENGTGLGLFLSHKIVCDMGGSIQADGLSEGGSRFEVRLPAATEMAGCATGDPGCPI